MDDLGDILYVVFIIITVFVSIVVKIRKSFSATNTQRPNTTTTTPNKPFAEPEMSEAWDDVLDDIEEFVQPESEPQPKVVVKSEPIIQPVAPQSQFKEGKHAGTPSVEHVDLNPEEDAKPMIDFSNLDEVKRAVIAHEIFDRKYC